MQPSSHKNKKRENKNELRIQDNKWYMDNSEWSITETSFREKNTTQSVYSSLKNFLKAIDYTV